ncbi:hypothetical protein GCM10025777_48040 [Membranihabitans marinus]|uniref:Secreted protein n=1 Tax=Nesterenkonia rhizosphaerae TaxID=1348272 RepID=A0ABP9FUU0_9MICC
MSETRLLLLGAYLGISLQTPRAFAAATDEGHGHSISGLPFADLWGCFHHNAGEFVSWYMRKRDPVVVTCPCVPVAAAQAGRLNPHHHPAWGSGGDRHLSHFRNRLRMIEN